LQRLLQGFLYLSALLRYSPVASLTLLTLEFLASFLILLYCLLLFREFLPIHQKSRLQKQPILLPTSKLSYGTLFEETEIQASMITCNLLIIWLA
jgi:hypothetical protein